jgi:hypothetical protein
MGIVSLVVLFEEEEEQEEEDDGRVYSILLNTALNSLTYQDPPLLLINMLMLPSSPVGVVSDKMW